MSALGLVDDGLYAQLPAVALLNSVFGACGAALTYALLRTRAGLPWPLALAGTAGAGLSFGLWFYSGNVEVYVLPLALLLAALYVLMAPEVTDPQLVAVGVLHGLAELGHQVHGLFAVVVVVALVRRGVATRGHLVRYLGSLVLVVTTAYGLVLRLVVRPGSLRAAADWFTTYARLSPGLRLARRSGSAVRRWPAGAPAGSQPGTRALPPGAPIPAQPRLGLIGWVGSDAAHLRDQLAMEATAPVQVRG